MRLFSDSPEIVSDAPVCASTCASEPASAGWENTVTSLARHADAAELVSIQGALCVALFCGGDVVALVDAWTDGVVGATKIISLRIVRGDERLWELNRVLGRAAVSQLLARIRQNPAPSIAVSGDFPVDVHA